MFPCLVIEVIVLLSVLRHFEDFVFKGAMHKACVLLAVSLVLFL